MEFKAVEGGCYRYAFELGVVCNVYWSYLFVVFRRGPVVKELGKVGLDGMDVDEM